MNNFLDLTQEGDGCQNFQIDMEPVPSQDSGRQGRTVRRVYCGDGVVEECSEDEEEKERAEAQARRQEAEERQKLDMQAKSMTWLPWMAYMAQKSAYKGVEVCDAVGEKLAWWLGITKPKFLYEIEEYNRIKQDEQDDIAEEIVVGNTDKSVHVNK